MRIRFLPAGFLLGGLALLGAGGLGCFVAADDPGVTIDEPDREFPAAVAGQELNVAFRIHNPTGHTVRIIGLAEC
jgi:hypothetical protein